MIELRWVKRKIISPLSRRLDRTETVLQYRQLQPFNKEHFYHEGIDPPETEWSDWIDVSVMSETADKR